MKNLVVIVVDATKAADYKIDQKARPPLLVEILLRSAQNPMTNYSIDTMTSLWESMRRNQLVDKNYEEYRKLCDENIRLTCKGSAEVCEAKREECYARQSFMTLMKPPYPEMRVIHIRFDRIKDPETKKYVGSIPTDFKLPKKDVELLIETGKTLLQESKHYQEFVKDLRE